jgi:hypothetical protein
MKKELGIILFILLMVGAGCKEYKEYEGYDLSPPVWDTNKDEKWKAVKEGKIKTITMAFHDCNIHKDWTLLYIFEDESSIMPAYMLNDKNIPIGRNIILYKYDTGKINQHSQFQWKYSKNRITQQEKKEDIEEIGISYRKD